MIFCVKMYIETQIEMFFNNNGVDIMICYGDDGLIYTLTTVLGNGGIGRIYQIADDSTRVAKIFHPKYKQRNQRVKLYRELTKSSEILRYTVLPQIILYKDESQTQQCGFVMECVDCSTTLTDIFVGNNPLSIKRKAVVGLNLCNALATIHKASLNSMIIGDFNFNNIVVNRSNGKIRIINSDNFQLRVRKKGTAQCLILPCTELHPDFFMPEILKLMNQFPGSTLEQLSNLGFQTFTIYTDYYCLAYNLHLLLLNCAPFSCALPATIAGKVSQHAPPVEMLNMNGNYCYSNLYNDGTKRTVRPEYCPDFNILTPKLQELFIRAFETGARQPELRPSPDEFIPALSEYIESLSFCECDGWNHYIRDGYNSSCCEWCRVERIAGSFTELPRRLEDIKYMTDQELKILEKKAKIKRIP